MLCLSFVSCDVWGVAGVGVGEGGGGGGGGGVLSVPQIGWVCRFSTYEPELRFRIDC